MPVPEPTGRKGTRRREKRRWELSAQKWSLEHRLSVLRVQVPYGDDLANAQVCVCCEGQSGSRSQSIDNAIATEHRVRRPLLEQEPNSQCRPRPLLHALTVPLEWEEGCIAPMCSAPELCKTRILLLAGEQEPTVVDSLRDCARALGWQAAGHVLGSSEICTTCHGCLSARHSAFGLMRTENLPLHATASGYTDAQQLLLQWTDAPAATFARR